MHRIFQEVSDLARSAKTTVALGVDLQGGTKAKGQKTPNLPYHGVICGRTSAGPWKQTSNTHDNSWDVADEDVPGADRVAEIASKRVGVLLCGELFSERARRSFGESNLQLSIDLGHVGMGQGLIPAMKSLVNFGSGAVIHSQHVAAEGRSLHYVDADGIQRSVPAADCEFVGDDVFWIAWRVREL